jgi:NADH-quinone oxidoreductase subunit M
MNAPLLSLIVFLPLAGAFLIMFLPKGRPAALRIVALAFSLCAFGLSIILYFRFEPGTAAFQFVERARWLGFGIDYHLGLDGINLGLVLLTTFLFPIVLLSSWTAIQDRVKEFLIFLLVLETGIIGVFLSLNLFLFYIFWEAMLIPMYFLIGIWGGKRRVYATLKFVMFTMFGSVLMLVAIIVLFTAYHRATGLYSFDLADYLQLGLSPGLQMWLFAAFGLAFAVKVPLFPLHTWLPDAHVEAPTAGSVILAAVLLKMGAYGFLRFGIPLFPDAVAQLWPYLAGLSLAGIIYGGFMALVQKDIKSLVAYSSVSHMGLVMLAVFSLTFEGTEGALFQMLSHGLSTGALFLIVGMLYERSHTRLIRDYGGLSRPMPVFSAFFLVCLLSSAGLPGLNGFVGEILCLFGVFRTGKILAILAAGTIILAAAYLLNMFRRVMQGPVTNERVLRFRDITLREAACLAPIVILMFWMGLYPQPLLRKMDASVSRYLQKANRNPRILVNKPLPAIKAPAPIRAVQPAVEEKDKPTHE